MLKKQSVKKLLSLITVLVAVLIPMFVSTQTIAEQWTLQSSVQQAIETSPELKKSIAELGVRQEDINLSNLWPDPEIEFRVDNRIGVESGSGGYEFTDVLIRQDIPWSRIGYQEEAATASMKAARFSQQFESLQVQNRVSKVFHQLQFASAKLLLAEKQLKLAKDLSGSKKTNVNGVVVRYLSPLEEMRLTIIREEAKQAEGSAEGKYSEALSEFVKLLGIDMSEITSVTELKPVSNIPDLKQLIELQSSHAQLSSQQQEVIAAKHNIDVARSTQTIDPTVSLTWSKDRFSSGRENIYGVMFNVQIPLSSRKNTAQSKATYKASQQKIELQLLKRELKINLNRSYTHMNHLIEQAIEYKKKVLKPASKMLALTDKGFTSGELNILSLVDANNTNFEAQLTYLDLLFQARIELAEVKLYAGQLITDTQVQNATSNNVSFNTEAK